MLNIAVLMGHLVAEPELRHTPSGVATCTFRIAVDRSYSKDGERKADFIDIVTSVSYTHLDVYKRQEVSTPRFIIGNDFYRGECFRPQICACARAGGLF